MCVWCVCVCLSVRANEQASVVRENSISSLIACIGVYVCVVCVYVCVWYHDVHTEREATNGVGAERAPGPLGAGPDAAAEEVLLVVVEVGRHLTRVVLLAHAHTMS